MTEFKPGDIFNEPQGTDDTINVGIQAATYENFSFEKLPLLRVTGDDIISDGRITFAAVGTPTTGPLVYIVSINPLDEDNGTLEIWQQARPSE